MQPVYILQGYGTINPDWVQSCLHLFKNEQVNLRKVVLLKNQEPAYYFSMLEIHFVLPKTQVGKALGKMAEKALDETLNHPFIEQLQATVVQQEWSRHSLRVKPN